MAELTKRMNVQSRTPALQLLRVKPIPAKVASKYLKREHYLHSMPGGTQLAFGVFLEARLLGVLTFGVGPANAHHLVEGAEPADCLTLSRLWLSDWLPAPSTRAPSIPCGLLAVD